MTHKYLYQEPGRAEPGFKWVYFIQCGEDGPIKIGESTDPVKRMAQIQTGCPDPLRIIGIMDYHSESEVHKMFSRLRIQGEWFKPDASLLHWISECAEDSPLDPWDYPYHAMNLLTANTFAGWTN